jgi:uncharacterized phage protein (TIGR02218 family)
MRTVPPALQANLDGQVLTPALLIRLARTDGITLGFCSADHDIVFGGLTYHSADGMGVTGVDISEGTGVDNMEVDGYLSDSRITEEDLEAGLYNGATITVYLVDRRDLAAGNVTLLKGYVGEVTITDEAHRAEVRSLSHLLKTPCGDQTSPLCRAQLGDTRCKVNLAVYTHARSASAVSADQLTLSFPDNHASGYYTKGVVRSTGGANSGFEMECKEHTLTGGTTAQMVLRDTFPYPFELVAGCQKRWEEDCRDKFGNGRNFHGERHLPGNDKIMQVYRPPRA